MKALNKFTYLFIFLLNIYFTKKVFKLINICNCLKFVYATYTRNNC